MIVRDPWRVTVVLGALVLSLVTSCTQVVQSPKAPAPAEDPSIHADQDVCRDLDAKGGGFYETFVFPMLAGGTRGRQTLDVDIVAMSHAVDALRDLGSKSRAVTSPEIRDQTDKTVRAAQAFDLYANADATSLLTAFTALAVACTNAGHQPSWFDPGELSG